jgi:hypothetical protein
MDTPCITPVQNIYVVDVYWKEKIKEGGKREE